MINKTSDETQRPECQPGEEAAATSAERELAPIRAKLVAQAEKGEWERETRTRTIRAMLRALYGEGGAACHAMTGEVLGVLMEEAEGAAAEGVVGAQQVAWALEDGRKGVGTGFSEWLTYCRHK